MTPWTSSEGQWPSPVGRQTTDTEHHRGLAIPCPGVYLPPMPAPKRLVTQHLELIHWEILKSYPEVIRALIRRRPGVYALYRKDKLYYVGLATNPMGRLNQHLRDRHGSAWDHFSVYLTVHDDHLKELESLILRIVKPKGNKQSGHFQRSISLYQTLNIGVKDADAERRAELLGGGVARRRRKTRVSRASRKLPLAGTVDRAIRLKGIRAGWEYRATLRKDGRIRYKNRLFDTPSHAARTAVGKGCSGLSFWRYRAKNGEWVALRNLKK